MEGFYKGVFSLMAFTKNKALFTVNQVLEKQREILNKSFSLNHEDCRWLMSKWLVSAFFGAVLLCRHDVESLWAAMGSVVNAALSVILKRILNQERPVSTLKSGPGMPSSHAQSILFSVIFAILSMVEWFGTNALTLTVSGLILAFGSYLSWLRVMEKYHTISQVVVGAVVGCIFSILWFWSWKAFVLEAFVSYLWVKFVVVTSAVGFCLGFIFYVIRYWLKNE